MNLRAVDTFHHTRIGHIVFGVAELVAMCLLALWALDTGSLWLWAGAALLLLGAVHNAWQSIRVYTK